MSNNIKLTPRGEVVKLILVAACISFAVMISLAFVSKLADSSAANKVVPDLIICADDTVLQEDGTCMTMEN